MQIDDKTMAEKQRKQRLTSFLRDQNDRARNVLNDGNRLAASYLACIAGMWTNCAKLPCNNPYSGEDHLLYEWFNTGYDAFTQSIGMTYELRKKMTEYEEKNPTIKNKC